MVKNPRLIDLSGKRFGMWLVSRQAGNTTRGAAVWRCQCDCGTRREVIGADLRSGKSTNCGCANKNRLGDARKTHGDSGSRLHQAWKNMRGRCFNSNRPGYKNYGGRGITVCPEWKSFEAFRDWALENGYQAHLTIERIDVNGNYEPSNCTWAGPDIQSANRRFVKRAPDGELWWHKARANGITRAAFTWRISKGWPMETVVSWPLGKRRVQRERDVSGRFV